MAAALLDERSTQMGSPLDFLPQLFFLEKRPTFGVNVRENPSSMYDRTPFVCNTAAKRLNYGDNHICRYFLKMERHGILTFSCLLFVLFEKIEILIEKINPDILHQIAKSQNPDQILFDSAKARGPVQGFFFLYYLHIKISICDFQ